MHVAGVALEAESKEVLRLINSKDGNVIVAERFLLDVVKEYGEHKFPQWLRHMERQAGHFLNLNPHTRSSYMRKVSWKEQCNASRAEPSVLMIKFYAGKRISYVNCLTLKSWINLL